ncbi:hypothetical protein L484_009134 [Morus notabilis]|uniref:Uncharacterized protein n=1 Tax=Morus notabilis TaxID=981085 RepID=W9R5P1_9ROSA|nr:hypothetical protein L484_009134 [Morus notabilis]
MKGFLVLISILLAAFLFFPSSIQARQLDAEKNERLTWKALNPKQPINCGRNHPYKHCVPQKPKEKCNGRYVRDGCSP